MTSLGLRVQEVRLFQRRLPLRIPFHFGAATISELTQLFVRVRVTLSDGASGWGVAAEVLAPKWFDKNPALSNEDNERQLLSAVALTRDAYCSQGLLPAWELSWTVTQQLAGLGNRLGLNDLIMSFGQAVMDRAVLDAVCGLRRISFYAAMRANVPGFAAHNLPPDFTGFDMPAFLRTLRPTARLAVRHTVGRADCLDDAEASDVENGVGLPLGLSGVIRRYRPRYFKLKLCGQLDADMERLCSIAAVLERCAADYRLTLDGNEQFGDVSGVTTLLDAIRARSDMRRFFDAILFLEQPFARAQSFVHDVGSVRVPVIIDEADDGYDAFGRAHACGYRGVSSKGCKGIYRSLINAARCARWSTRKLRYFLSAEDLTCPQGVALQQDLALAALVGVTHTERNAYHFIGDDVAASASECEDFQRAHPDLYEALPNRLRLRILNGEIRLDSLGCTGFALGAQPDWINLRDLKRPLPAG